MASGTLTVKRQDVYTKKELADIVIPQLPKGKFQIDVGENGETKISSVSNRWIQRYDLELTTAVA